MNVTPSQLALAWVLHQGAVAIPGTKRRRYLEENVAAAEVTLTTGDIAAIEAVAPHGVVTANALMPGNIADTSLARHMDMQQVADFIASGELALPPQKTVEQGAATSVLLAASPTVEGVIGRYFEDCAQAEPVAERAGAVAGVARYALDRENAARLWAVSEALVG
ncbi:aldo/keto reductase [Streptomyces avermitilis]|uniref:aldo/keto reductase n=1 Tax=Streptomyces avermitilis TaxID=33903 RepID=UPI003410C48B